MSGWLMGMAETPRCSRAVRIDALTANGCAIDGEELPEEGSFDLWIGAIGPFPTSIVSRHDKRAIVAFNNALANEVVSHFAAA